MRFCWMMFLVGALWAESNEEALFVRRIADFWEEGEYQLAKSQIEEFIGKYPDSPHSDPLCAALGDLLLREKNFFGAFDHYNKIRSAEYADKVFLNRLECLYEMQWYATLADECEKSLENGPNLHATYFLAIALYHQCLNASKEPEQLLKLAERARPYFETLSQSELSREVAQSYAHLCCILKDYSRASSIYLDLAQQDPEGKEEMLFQAALIQSEEEKELALQTFDQIAKMGQKRAQEAAYNRLVLAFDLGKYEELSQEKSLSEIPPERAGMARLLLGRSFLNLKKYPEAIAELKMFIEESSDPQTLEPALLALLEAASQAGDFPSFEAALQKLASAFPNDSELPKAYFTRAQMFAKAGQIQPAKQQLEQILTQFPAFAQKAEVAFELALLDYKQRIWDGCRQKSSQFLADYPDHPLASFAWRYLVSSSAELAVDQPLFRSQLIEDLSRFLQTDSPAAERAEWELLLAKTYYELSEFEQALAILSHLKTPNARLLYALTLRDSSGNLELFVKMAEEALAEKADLIEPAQIQMALFSACIELSQFEKGADHLYQALEAHAEAKTENLLWLADFYFPRFEQEPGNLSLAHRMATILLKCKAALQPTAPSAEEILCKLAQVYLALGQVDDSIALLKTVAEPSAKVELLLAEGLIKKEMFAEAIPLLDAIVLGAGTMRDPISAAASLELARLKLKQEHRNGDEIATQLKTIALQKNLEGEPTYLEAALDYVSLQCANNGEKKRALLEKTKLDFQSKTDLLSNDYHEARHRFPQKNRLFEGYMELIEAEILLLKGELEASKLLLEKIIHEQNTAALLKRARMLLVNIDEPKASL